MIKRAYTTISVSFKTKDKLARFAKFGESFSTAIDRLIKTKGHNTNGKTNQESLSTTSLTVTDGSACERLRDELAPRLRKKG